MNNQGVTYTNFQYYDLLSIDIKEHEVEFFLEL
jgi:hypothetical protein